MATTHARLRVRTWRGSHDLDALACQTRETHRCHSGCIPHPAQRDRSDLRALGRGRLTDAIRLPPRTIGARRGPPLSREAKQRWRYGRSAAARSRGALTVPAAARDRALAGPGPAAVVIAGA